MGIILPFDGTHASIPAGWSRRTDFDDKYLKGTASGWGDTGGAATHTHDGSSHTHSFASSHTHTTGNLSHSHTVVATNGRHQDAPTYEIVKSDAYHASVSSGVSISESCSTDSFTTDAADNEYSRYHFIFVEKENPMIAPTGAILMKDNTEARTAATHFDSGDARYLKGASAGADAGNATDVTTHAHTQSHAHTFSHGHGSVNSGSITGLIGTNNGSGSFANNHTHTVSFSTANQSVSNTTSLSTQTAELPYQELHFWKVDSDNPFQVGDIAITTDASLPPGWNDAGFNTGVYVRGKAVGEAVTGDDSVAVTHTHANLSHSHSIPNHTHSISTTSVSGSRGLSTTASDSMAGGHSHTGTTSSAGATTSGSTSTSFSSDNHEPEYIKVRFIKATSPGATGQALLAILENTWTY